MTFRRYIFTYAGKAGPMRRVFDCPHHFDAYVAFWRSSVSPVSFDSPFVARGSL